MHLSVDSNKPLSDLRRDLLLACAREGLVVDDGGAPRPSAPCAPPAPAGGVAPALPKAFVIELADPLPELHAAAAGPTDGRTWRVSGYLSEGGRSRVSTIRPTQLLDLLGHPELAGPALLLEQRLERALKDAAGWDDARTAR